MTTTRKPSLRWTLDCLAGTERQADTYRKMAEAIRQLDPQYRDDTVNEEVARFTRLVAEMDEAADELREQLIEWYTPEQIEAAL